MPRSTRLSERLQGVADMVRAGETIADIGTDHGLLVVALIESGRVPRAIGCDLRPEPLRVAEGNVRRARLQAAIELRLGDGLAPVTGEQLGTVTIAGMGGLSIAGILERGRLDGIRRVVTAPNEAEELVRRVLWKLGFWPVDERMIEEDGHHYPIIAAERTPKPDATPPGLAAMFIGPVLERTLAAGDPAVVRWARVTLERFELSLRGLANAKAQNEVAQRKRADFEARAKLLRERLETSSG